MILKRWDGLKGNIVGRWVFNVSLWLYVPYTGSIRPEVLELRPGHCKIKMRDRKRLRNHLSSIHAAALMNLAEVSSGLAFVCSLPKDLRAIVTQFTIEYVKKARGDLIAECNIELPSDFKNISEKKPFQVEAKISDSAGDLVAVGRATWLVSPGGKK